MRNLIFVIFPVYIMLRTLIPVHGLAVPSPPRNVTIQVKPHYLLVTWEPPIETHGEITMYIVSYSIFPDLRITTNNVGGASTFSLIPVGGHEGQLVKIQVQAQDQVGIGNPSVARYVRIGCGRTIWLDPSASTSLIFPETGITYSAGVICKWTVYTNDTFSLTFMFASIQLVAPSNESCIDAYVSIGNEGRFCHAQEEGKDIVSRENNVTVIFKSGTGDAGKGFYLKIMSTVKLPGPPTSITMKSGDNAVILTWAPPTGLTLPITSYVIHYSVLPDGPTLSIVVGPNRLYFAIGTKSFEGKVLVISVTARTESVQGDTSKPLYVRAPCHKILVLEPDIETNISSPNYPSHYPAGIICTWSIRAHMEATLSAKFLDFQLQDSSFCSSDYITLSINPDQRFCGVMKPSRTFETDESTLDVQFVSDSEKQERGFLLQVLAKRSQRVSTRDNYWVQEMSSSTQRLPTAPASKLQTTETTRLANTIIEKTKLTLSTLPISVSAKTSSLLSSTQAAYSKPSSQSTSSTVLNTTETTDHQPKLAASSPWTPPLSFENITQSTDSSSSISTMYRLMNLSFNTKRLQNHQQEVILSTSELTIPSNGSTILFKPNLDGMAYPVSIWLQFIPRRQVSTNVFNRELQEKLRPTFNTTELFEDIDVVQNLIPKTFLMLICARYNLLKTLKLMAKNSTFELITYLNDTSLDIIQNENLTISGWNLNASFMEEFRKSDKLKNEKLSNICERLVKELKMDVCKNDHVPYPVNCVQSNIYDSGIACRMECPAMGCTKCVIDNNTNTISCRASDKSTQYEHESFRIPLASSLAGVCVMIGLLVGCITWRNRKKKMKVNLQSGRRHHVEMHDILQNQLAVNGRWHLTSLTTPNETSIIAKTARRSASFPNFRREKIKQEVETGMRQFGSFIEDKESLRKRLNKKHSIRRTNSV